MWFNIIKDSSIEHHIEELIPKVYAHLVKQGIKPTEEQMEKALISLIKDVILQGKKYPHEFLKV